MIPYLLDSPSTEEACRRAKINKTTVYEWLKDETFRNELKSQRDGVIEHALDTLKAGMAKATGTLVALLDSESESVQVRAAQSILDYGLKAIEHEQLEQRITALEERLQQRGNR